MKNHRFQTAFLTDQPILLESTDLHNLIDSLSTLVFSLSEKGHFIFINQTVHDVLGYAPEELISTPCIDLVIEADKEKTFFYFEQMATGHTVIHFENGIHHKDGSIIPISWAARWDPKDSIFYCTVRDITERRQIMELRKRYQDELKNQNQEMSDMLERITDGFFVMDNQWRITYANSQALNIVNCTYEQVYLKTLWESFPNAAGSIFETQYGKAVAEQIPVNFEAFYPEPLNMWIEVSAYPSATGLSVYFRNITQRKRQDQEREDYEHKIEEQNSRMKMILERITDGFMAVDSNWTITFSNKQGEDIIGMPHDKMISKNLWECFPNARGTVFETNLRKALCEQEPVYFETYSIASLILLELSVYPSDNGLTIFYRDVTEKRKTEEAIQRLSLIAKETNNAVSLVELDGTISWINNAYTKITGYTAEETIGQKNSELLFGDESDCITIAHLKDCFNQGKPFRGEVVAYTKKKKKLWLEVSGQRIHDNLGRVQRYFFILSDITERKRLEQELDTQRKKTTAAVLAAQEKERAFVGQELHDNVNQILTTVKLYTELIRDGIGNTSEMANKSIQLLQDSINEIRSLSKRLSAPSQQNIKFKDSIQELTESVSATDKISISLDIAKIELLEINQELQLAIYRILQEHLTNILKHAEAEIVQIVFDHRDGNLVLKVTDNGKGFDLKRKRNGIGITNMITRAENLNGALSINSAPGLGCVLIVQLPLT
jgi:PAS domain S-box-containing protein